VTVALQKNGTQIPLEDRLKLAVIPGTLFLDLLGQYDYAG
jgi:hypothetical protein